MQGGVCGMGSGSPTILQDQFCNSSKSDTKLLGWGVMSKDLRSLHETGKTFHKSCNNDIQFPTVFLFKTARRRYQL